MQIKIKAESGRRIAWTDRRDGYVQFLFDKNNPDNGYYRNNTKYFSDIVSEGVKLTSCKSAEVFPYGFSADFGGNTVEAALLMEEQAFYISAVRNVELLSAVPVRLAREELPLEGVKKGGTVEGEVRSRKIAEWHESKVDGISVVSSDFGLAVASDFEFYYSVRQNEDLILNVSDKNGLKKTAAAFKNTGWYVAFEADEKTAVEKAVRLAKTKGIESHVAMVDAFLNKADFDFGDRRFNESVQWARFSGWMLASKDHGAGYRGIWAGLPWFRDNWGRDTFISLCGILLVSGCFDEAKDVLLGFAGFQDLRKDSPTYGRIPNRYRDETDVIYNTVDGSLWFIRALWEYVQYSADMEIIKLLKNTIEIAVDAEAKNCDEHGFLMHADADTWMDARIEGKEPWSPRGNRANDIQALWFTALKIVSQIERMTGNSAKAEKYNAMAEKTRQSFKEYFWNKDCNALADHLPEGGYGDWFKDMRVRPNQLFSFMVPSVLDLPENEYFIEKELGDKILENVKRELVNPFGLYSLSPEDPLFHAEHNDSSWYHKDAAYHNGTIWEWNTGAYITGCSLSSRGVMADSAVAILQNYSKMIMDCGCAGSLSENIHARPAENGFPKLSGTFSQAWSIAEYCRNICQDVVGFYPQLATKHIKFAPCLPGSCREIKASLPFGNGWRFGIDIKRKGKVHVSSVEWILPAGKEVAGIEELDLNGIKIKPNTKIEITTAAEYTGVAEKHAIEKFECPSKWNTRPFAVHNLDNEFCGAEHKKNYLNDLILSGRMYSKCSGGENTGALEWYFESEEFNEKYNTNLELGALYGKKSTTFHLWAPTAKAVSVSLFKDGNDSPAESVVQLKRRSDKGASGVWEGTVKGDLHGKYYLYTVLVHGVEQISSDPYAKACGVNGKRSMIVDFGRTNPEGWDSVSAPVVKNPCDVVAYEAHIADITSSPAWNGDEKLRRTYLGACQSGTSLNGVPTGFDHIKDLGVTHVQLLPVFDFRSVDEANVNKDEVKNRVTFGNFNWGYDPENYACVEGSYSTNPFDGAVRIKEFKQLVKSYADAGIGIIMDVVYNHVNDGLHQGLGTSVPGYFYRVEGFSGAGEDTAGERAMFRKYMVDTLCFWLKEYKLSGFRFDLMGLHDVKAMNAIHEALHKIKGDVLIYGEGWDMYRAGKMDGATQGNSHLMHENIGFFNDAFRCAVKGTINADKEKGFIHDGSRRESVKFGIVGATNHPQVDFKKVEGTAAPKPWGDKTWLSVNYTEIHDNITLRDKIFMVEQDKPEEYLDQMQKMAISLVLLAEGYPILHAGMEFCRSKEVPEEVKALNPTFYEYGVSDDKKHLILHNTYNVTDKVNNLDWNRCVAKQDVNNYVKQLIQLRKNHPAFRIAAANDCEMALHFLDNKKAGLPESVLAWEIDGTKCGDSWKKILVVANPFTSDVKLELNGKGKWKMITDGKQFVQNPEELEDGAVVSVSTKCTAVFVME